MIVKEHQLSITKQCQILQLSRSSVYHMPAPVREKDRELMRLIDEIHLEEPYLGSRGIKSVLRMRGQKVGRIHIRTLMRKMGIEALDNMEHRTYSIPTRVVS
jgi:putative transposase